MPLPDHLKRLARRVAQHEMGHYVVARALGFQTGDVSIEIVGPLDGHHGKAAIRLQKEIPSIEALQVYLERRVMVLYAGGAAEALPGQGLQAMSVDIDKAIRFIKNTDQGAEQDYAKARELIHILRNISERQNKTSDTDIVKSQLDELDSKLFYGAVELVESHAETIIGLAGNLANRVKTTKAVVKLEADYLESLPSVQQIAQAKP